ncbi:hypothetical protein PYJP_12160 [Pyrofollis japonicus]|uniref:hypothetical protein n=1 Tax=Pyrofollis japonicus TaxID=3060460 RepID=UPI00295A9B24|nr:hypothetical protein [Pyrofollis japonicus]BEP17864.1 hypothetical protein PYJP_12160 [Pyrofollis japonicus]
MRKDFPEPSGDRIEFRGSTSLDYRVVGVTRLLRRSGLHSLCEKGSGRLEVAHFIGAEEVIEAVQHAKRMFVRCRYAGPPGITKLVLLEIVSFDPWLYLREELGASSTEWRLFVEPGYMPSILHVEVDGREYSYKLGYDVLLPLRKMGMSRLIDQTASRAANILENHGYVVAGYATHKHGIVENLVLVADTLDLRSSIRMLITIPYTNVYVFGPGAETSIHSTETRPEKIAKLLNRVLASREDREKHRETHAGELAEKDTGKAESIA